MRIIAKRRHGTGESRGRWRHSAGYLLYAVVAGAVSLWLLFPAESVQRLLVRALAGLVPGIEWRVGSVGLHLPFILRVAAVEGYTDVASGTPALRVDQLDLWPDLSSSFREQRPWFHYHLRIASGLVDGRVGQRQDKQGYSLQGTARSLQLERLPLLAQRLGRNIRGTVSASFEGEHCPGTGASCQWKVQCKLEQGRLAFVRPVLHHSEFPFSQVGMLLRGAGAKISIAEGKIASPWGDGWFNGTLQLAANPIQSQVELRGGLHPQPAFFEGVENTVALQSVRVELQEKPLPFSLSGTLHHPGIHFESLAMQMYALEKELR